MTTLAPRPVARSSRSTRASGRAGWITPLVTVIAVGSVSVVGSLVHSPLLAVTAPLVIVLAIVESRRRRRWRAELARADALPVVVDHLLQRLGAGSSLSSACRSLAAVGGAGAQVSDPLVVALGRGSTLVDASRAIGTHPDPSVRLLATTLRLLATNGGPAVPALRRLRHTLIGRAHRHRRAQAQAASATSSAGLLVLAPGAFAVVLAGTEPALARFYLNRPLGAACASASILLSALGWWWIQHLLARFRVAGR